MLLTLACADSKNPPTLTNGKPLQIKARLSSASEGDPSYPTSCIAPYPPGEATLKSAAQTAASNRVRLPVEEWPVQAQWLDDDEDEGQANSTSGN